MWCGLPRSKSQKHRPPPIPWAALLPSPHGPPHTASLSVLQELLPACSRKILTQLRDLQVMPIRTEVTTSLACTGKGENVGSSTAIGRGLSPCACHLCVSSRDRASAATLCCEAGFLSMSSSLLTPQTMWDGSTGLPRVEMEPGECSLMRTLGVTFKLRSQPCLRERGGLNRAAGCLDTHALVICDLSLP